ncbi:hypothetical protein CcCBS67573_g05175 [Chytriomyces confervae]|uniref:Gag1-like clamp domain-containing protein n=1 Tax=Chytriomyces confervae TaxID=246404 RepID=A0A507FB35_9FUNG|nr:hypothetical protein HDU80_005412 [Chytriomyces hyalinus]TPX73551.1 hypothetical protein CcCBS67573_g05175 [Chytriomyces confervae]
MSNSPTICTTIEQIPRSLLHQPPRNPSPSNPSTTSLSPSTTPSRPVNEGLPHWEDARRTWTRGHKPYDPNADCYKDYKRHTAVEKVDPVHFNGVYDSIVNGRRFSKPVPLNFITAVLIHGWKREGLWEAPVAEPDHLSRTQPVQEDAEDSQ